MAIGNQSRITNRLISILPRKERLLLLAECETVDLHFGEILQEADGPVEHAYFPLMGFISLVTTLEGHLPLEMGLIGNEGMLGMTLALGIKTAPLCAVVQGDGTALRIRVALLWRRLADSAALRRVLERYLYVTLSQLTQSSACTRFHEIEPRLARWLLMTHDRSHAEHFHLTHEYLAGMLGVRRSGVSIAAGSLQTRKLIRYTRGEILILDRQGLELASCECYAATLHDYANQFGTSTPQMLSIAR